MIGVLPEGVNMTEVIRAINGPGAGPKTLRASLARYPAQNSLASLTSGRGG
jgi:hypothetical protein